MADATYKKIEIVGTSAESLSAAINNAIAKASETIHNLAWFEVVEQRGNIADGKVQQFQVTLRVGFKVD